MIASGHRLYWINIAGPRAGDAQAWPKAGKKSATAADRLRATGPLAAGEKVCLYQQTGRLKKEIELAPLGVRGGNLLPADGRLLIATPSELIVLGTKGEVKKILGTS